jgi:hypothetical protein
MDAVDEHGVACPSRAGGEGRDRSDLDIDPTPLAVERDDPVDEREEGVV